MNMGTFKIVACKSRRDVTLLTAGINRRLIKFRHCVTFPVANQTSVSGNNKSDKLKYTLRSLYINIYKEMKRSMIFAKSPKSMIIKIMRVPYDLSVKEQNINV